jgi:hypothetical protein
MKTGLILCGVFLLLAVLVGALGHYEGAKHGAAITTEVQQAVVHTASLTTEEALVEGGKKDATPGWRLTSALYDKKNNEVCYTYSGSGHGILYEEVYRESGAWIVYHSNGLEEFSNGRTNYWEAGDNPCTRMKDIAKILGNKYKIVDLLLTPAENICMDKTDAMPVYTDRQVAVAQAAIYACFGEPIPADVQAALNKPKPHKPLYVVVP